jgi:hypothetical protein
MNNASPNRRKERKRTEKTLERRGSFEPPGMEVVPRIWNAPGEFPVNLLELRDPGDSLADDLLRLDAPFPPEFEVRWPF